MNSSFTESLRQNRFLDHAWDVALVEAVSMGINSAKDGHVAVERGIGGYEITLLHINGHTKSIFVPDREEE